MKKNELTQAPFASTLMSSVKTAFEYNYDTELSDCMLFGLSGHAFVTHVTNGLGPCAPYTFDMEGFNILCKENLGLDMFTENMFVSNDATEKQKQEVSNKIKDYLDTDFLVFMSSYEYQIIKDYNDTHFLLTSPWGDAPSETGDIELDTLIGMKDFMSLYKVLRTNQIDILEGIKNSIKYAMELQKGTTEMVDSGFGIHAFDFWLNKVTDKNVNGHGNWWSNTVWAESRTMASAYMQEIKPYFNKNQVLDELSNRYNKSNKLFTQLSSKEGKKEEKMKLIKELKENELSTLQLLSQLI